ncbi:unnamed protein product [Protopolystoma xenopodis]|uniref:Uncharacterized protein n=1 Tax=Protopolystoma xenopodis TaxID=117903 RepID=A0A448WJI0_9PLAT|nr:unnamed protein product [Protopolystoma xenopodis]
MIYPGSVSYTDPTSLHQLLLSSPNAAQSETNEDDMRLANGVLGRHTSVDIQRAGFPASPVLGSGSAFGYSTGAIATGNMTSGAMQNCANEGCGQPVAGETRLNRPFGVSFGSYTGTFPRRHVSTGRLSSVGLAQPCLSGGQASYLRASSIRLSTAGVSGDVMIMNGGLRTHSQNHNGPSLSSMLPGSGGQGSFEAGDCPRSPYQQSQQPFKQHNLKTSSFTSQPRQYHQMQNQGVNQQQEELTDVLASNAALQNGSNFLVYADKSQLSLAKQGRPILLQLPNSLSSTQVP